MHAVLLAGSLFLALALPLRAGNKVVEFSRKLEAGGIDFTVISPNKSVGNTVTIKTHGLKHGDYPHTQPVEGLVRDVEAADLGSDGSPELFVYTVSAGSGSYGKAYAWSTNGKKVLTDIFITPPEKKDLRGYMGHDEFAVIENSFARRFPVYRTGDSNSSPTGGWRQFQYKLQAGEAGWLLRIKRIDSF
jgi:hypothetical protein